MVRLQAVTVVVTISVFAGTDFSFPLTMLRDIHCRLRNLQRTALEFFLLDQTNYFVNFNKVKLGLIV